MPNGLDVVDAAAVPETFFTVWTNVFDRGRLAKGETLLVHGGSSGIGTTAIQLAVALGSRAIATAGSAEKCKACESLGAFAAIDYKTEDFVARTKALTDNRGVDVVLDMVGADYFQRNLEVLTTEGRLVQIATQTGIKSEINLLTVMQKRLTITGSTLRPRTIEQKGGIARALEKEVWPLFAAGKVKPVVYKRFPLVEAADAHRLMESSEHIGKIILVA